MDADHEQEAPRPEDLPGSIVPRWLALLVLIALIAAAGKCVEWALVAPPYQPSTGQEAP